MDDIYTGLAAPFSASDLEWRAGAVNKEKTRALALAYITSRAVMDRLDRVVGPANWRDEYRPGPDGGLICGLSLRVEGEWITKWDGAENTLFEEVKGGLSGAFKRAAVKWGIGRYLYRLPSVWVPCAVAGKTIALKATPPLPEWALPVSDAGNHPSDEQIEDRIQGVRVSGNGNGSHPEQSRSISWSKAVVDAVLEAGAAESPLQAVQMLNASDLPTNITPDQAAAWILSSR
jgi:hypothetical protein